MTAGGAAIWHEPLEFDPPGRFGRGWLHPVKPSAYALRVPVQSLDPYQQSMRGEAHTAGCVTSQAHGVQPAELGPALSVSGSVVQPAPGGAPAATTSAATSVHPGGIVAQTASAPHATRPVVVELASDADMAPPPSLDEAPPPAVSSPTSSTKHADIASVHTSPRERLEIAKGP